MCTTSDPGVLAYYHDLGCDIINSVFKQTVRYIEYAGVFALSTNYLLENKTHHFHIGH